MIQRMFVTIDTKKTNYKNVGKINHGDDLILELTVLSDGNMISFNNPMVDLLVKKSDGKMIRQNSGIEHIKPNKFIIEVSKDCVTSPGLSTNQLVINDNGRISTCMFYYTILNSLEEDVIQSISSVEVLEQLDEYVIQARERMESLNNDIKELEELFGATSDNLVEAEMARNEAEQNRAQSEILRLNNENDRIEADNIRNQNEVDRSSSELVREQRESERILNEEERRQNESERMIDESTRQQNENARQSNESIRMSNENDRKTQENRRVTAETNRVNAETIRRNNENSRISNESERQKTMNEMKSLLEDARGFDDRVGVIEDEIEEINSSLDNKMNKFNRNSRIMFVSDIHFSKDVTHGIDSVTRMNLMVDKLIEEHGENPIDFLVINGDLSLDYRYRATSREPYNYSKKVVSMFLSKLPFPVYLMAGNHDNYSNQEWINITGQERQYTIDFDDIIIICLDTFKPSINETYPGMENDYTGIDFDYLAKELEKYKGKKILLVSHYFDESKEPNTVKELINKNYDILGLICGHTHRHNVTTFGNKPLFFTGTFGYSLDGGISNTYLKEQSYGFRDIYVKENGLYSCYIEPEINLGEIEQSYSKIDEILISTDFMSKDTSKYKAFKERGNNLSSSYNDKYINHLCNNQLLNEGDDLNSILEYGTYVSLGASMSATLLNTPHTASGFKLVVERVNNSGYSNVVRQTILCGHGSIYGYTRLLDGSKPTECKWYSILTSAIYENKIERLMNYDKNTTYRDIHNALFNGQTVIFNGDGNSNLLPQSAQQYGGVVECYRASNTTMIINVNSKNPKFPVRYSKVFRTDETNEGKWNVNSSKMKILTTPSIGNDIEIPVNLKDFSFLKVRVVGDNTLINVPIISETNALRGVGMNCTTNTGFDMYSFFGTYTENTINITACKRIKFTNDSNTISDLEINEIYVE